MTNLVEAMDGDAEAVRELAEAFAKDCPARLGELRAAIAAGDPARTQREAHNLKGAAANFGAWTTQHLADALEHKGHEGDLTDADSLLRELERELKRVTAFLTTALWPHDKDGCTPSPTSR